MHINHKAGDKMFVGFTGKKLELVDRQTGEIQQVEVFVALLAASQYTYVEAVASQKKEDWVEANQNALYYFGGVPRAVVPDCLKSAVTTPNKYEPVINPEYADFARYFQTVILPARPNRPKDKALVEGAIREELQKYNGKVMQKLGMSRKQFFEQIEKSELLPLSQEKYARRNFKSLKVQFNYYIYLSDDKHHYSVPYRYRAKQIQVIYTDSVVEIFHKNKRIAFHKRNRTPNGYTTITEHMPSHHQAASLGEYVQAVVEHILRHRQHPEQAYKVCMGILNLTKSFDAGRGERQNRKLKRLLTVANFRYKASFEQIDFSQSREMDKNLLLRLCGCQWLKKPENVLITGPTGVGKSFIACALGHKACLEGFKVLYCGSMKLFAKLKLAKADGTYEKELYKIQKQNLLILDDFGLHPIDEQSKLILLEMLEDRYGEKSTVIASQFPVKTWYDIIATPRCYSRQVSVQCISNPIER